MALENSKKLKIGSVVIDCVNFDAMLVFWQEALHYTQRYPASDGWAILDEPDRNGTSISLNRVSPSEKLHGRNWLHFDLYTRNQSGEVTRLLNLGAQLHEQKYDPDDDFIVLEDPDGNLFCVVDTNR